MPKLALTDASVRALKAPSTGQLTVWDANSPIGVRVSQGGSKTFILLMGSGQRHTIGRYPVIGLSDARTEARRVLAEKTLGIRPEKSGMRFEPAVKLFLEEHHAKNKPRVKQEAKRLLARHFASFNDLTLSDIGDRELDKALKKITAPTEKLHAFRALRTFFKWCTRPPRRYLTHSPLEGYEAPSQDRKGTRVLTDEELVKVWKACKPPFGPVIQLMTLWGTRKGETARLQRTWIEGDILIIPGAFTKNKRTHAVPLLPMARSILEEQRHNGAYLFRSPADHTTHLGDGSWGKPKAELDEASGVENWQLRDLRRTFRSNQAKLGTSRNVAELLVNHVTGSERNELDEIYDRYDYLDEKRAALEKWEAYLTQLLAP